MRVLSEFNGVVAAHRCWYFLVPVVILVSVFVVPNAVGRAEDFVLPTNLQAWQSGRSVELTWDPPAVGYVLGYNVYRSGTSNGPWTKLNDELVDSTTYVDHSPISDIFYYAVSAVSASAIETDLTLPSGITFFSEVANDASDQIFSLTHFPLLGKDWRGAYDREIINSVFDHSMKSSYQDNLCPWEPTDKKCVIAYTGEIGNTDPVDPTRINGIDLYAYAKPDKTSFSLYGSYRGANGDSSHLYYDGHDGIDYSTGGEMVPVYAAATGKLRSKQCKNDPPKPCNGTLVLEHPGSGYTTYYRHLSEFESLELNAEVQAGTQIGKAGGVPCEEDAKQHCSIHLHFEVRKDGVPVDPYGWKGEGSDPYIRDDSLPGHDLPERNLSLWGRGQGGHLRGRLFVDSNGNQQQDAGEALIGTGACQTERLVKGFQVIWSGTSSGGTTSNLCDPNPYYDSGAIPADSYTVQLTMPLGWNIVGANPVTVTVDTNGVRHLWFAVRESGGTDPFGVLDAPSANATVTGPVPAAGWVLDQEDATLTVELLVDNQRVSSSPIRHARPDVCNAFPTITHCASSQPGFTFTWNTATVTNGAHTLAIRVTDPGGRNMSFGSRTVTVSATPTLSFTDLTPSTINTSTAGYQPSLSATGSNFTNVTSVTFNWSGAVNGTTTWNRGDSNWNAKVTVNSDTSMTLRPVVTASGDPAGTTTWTVTLRDTTGATAVRTFTVTYTVTPTLSFTDLTPSTINTSTAGYQPSLSATGSNFTNGTSVTFNWSGAVNGTTTWNRGDSNWNAKVTVNSDTSMTLRPVVTASGDPAGTTTWTVTLRDTTGATAVRTFTVTYIH